MSDQVQSAVDTTTTSLRKFAVAAAVLLLGFAIPLWKLMRLSIGDDLYSYIPMMPLVSGYLIWTQKAKLPRESNPARKLAGGFCLAGAAALAGYFFVAPYATPANLTNSLALSTLAFLLFLTAAGCWFLGGARMRLLAFAFFLLFFMIPFPVAMRDGIEAALQQGSAATADWMFAFAGASVLRNDLLFRLPDITLRVAPECSGIHSTLVLLITSLLAGQVILRRNWSRAILCLAVIPLALLRNGFRVWVLGELCIHIGPQMIDSPIHHHGGPLFFVLSLIPFFLLLYFLKKAESRRGVTTSSNLNK